MIMPPYNEEMCDWYEEEVEANKKLGENGYLASMANMRILISGFSSISITRPASAAPSAPSN